jgi:hypothetical protein
MCTRTNAEPVSPVTLALYDANSPAVFWRPLLRPEPSADDWAAALRAAAELLPPAARAAGLDATALLTQTLGEGQFGPHHHELSTAKRAYYAVKPLLPRPLTRLLRRVYRSSSENRFALEWPIEPRYARFQWEVVRQLLARTGQPEFLHIHFWPHGSRCAFVLTHDIETAPGQAHARVVADLDAQYGFRSSFNFVPERYPVDRGLMEELRARGFEIGVHGLKHDGKLFRSPAEFRRRAARINGYLKDFGAVGFRAPLTHRNPEWMQALEIEYDLSFFDTDPYEPMPGGTMSIWPFQLGRFVELPYTLVQDYTLTAVLKETTPRIWLEKVDFLERYAGLALLNTHPDYLRTPATERVYAQFLEAMSRRTQYWHALPKEVARWWRDRAQASSIDALPGATLGQIPRS